jgi:hypothetical protein
VREKEREREKKKEKGEIFSVIKINGRKSKMKGG